LKLTRSEIIKKIVEIKKELEVFKYIDFDEPTHRYSYLDYGEGKNPNVFPVKKEFSISGTGWVHKFVKPFDANFWSKKKAEEEGITQQEMLDRWKEISDIANAKGTLHHLYMEFLLDGKVMEYDNEHLKQMGDSFYTDYKKGYTSIVNELMVADKKSDIAGMLDNLSLGNDGKLYIFDHKTNKELKFENKWSTMLAPFKKFPDANFYHYSLQLSLYKYIIEKNTKLKINGGMKLSYFSSTKTKYQVHNCVDLTKEIKKILEK